jgi:hypothetical protein
VVGRDDQARRDAAWLNPTITRHDEGTIMGNKKVEPKAATKKTDKKTTDKDRKQSRKTGRTRWSDASIKHAVVKLD